LRPALLNAIAIALLFCALLGVWNALVTAFWFGLGAAPQLANLATKFVALTIFTTWAVLDRRRWDLGLGRPTNARAIRAIVPLVAVVLALNIKQAAFVELAPAALLSAAVAACWEELAFRGVLMGRLLPYGRVAAAWISSLGFGLLHAAQPDLLAAALSVFMVTGLGLSLAALRLATGSIWPPFIAHLIVNLSASATVGAVPAAQSPLPLEPLLMGTYFLAYGAFLLSALPPETKPASNDT
jgi:membrane protease YdiL (CAAX protease family)